MWRWFCGCWVSRPISHHQLRDCREAVYACGKTFLWPTMLAVASERFPKGGAIAIGALGGAGMLSAGLFGGPGIGFKQDFNASSQLKQEAPEVYERYKAEEEKKIFA